MAYASVVQGHRNVGKNGEVRIIRTEIIGTTLVNVIQTAITETEEYLGLSEADAKSLASKYDASTSPSGLIKSSLGGIKVTVGLSWFSVYSCRGTIETAKAARMGDSNLWRVDYQKQTLSVTADGGTVENI